MSTVLTYSNKFKPPPTVHIMSVSARLLDSYLGRLNIHKRLENLTGFFSRRSRGALALIADIELCFGTCKGGPDQGVSGAS